MQTRPFAGTLLRCEHPVSPRGLWSFCWRPRRLPLPWVQATPPTARSSTPRGRVPQPCAHSATTSGVAASRSGMDAATLREVLTSDRTAWVDAAGHLLLRRADRPGRRPLGRAGDRSGQRPVRPVLPAALAPDRDPQDLPRLRRPPRPGLCVERRDATRSSTPRRTRRMPARASPPPSSTSCRRSGPGSRRTTRPSTWTSRPRTLGPRDWSARRARTRRSACGPRSPPTRTCAPSCATAPARASPTSASTTT